MKDGRRLDDGYSAPRKSSEVMYMVCRGLATWKKNASLDIYLVKEVKERRHDRRCQDVNARQAMVYCELRRIRRGRGGRSLDCWINQSVVWLTGNHPFPSPIRSAE